MQEVHLFFPIFIHTESEKVRQLNPRKIYAVDTGLVRACSRRTDPDTGHLLENLVFLELRRRGLETAYYRTASGRELDFIARASGQPPMLVQVCTDISDEETRAREVGALREAMTEVGADSGTVVTLFEEATLEAGSGHIDVVPAWRWVTGW